MSNCIIYHNPRCRKSRAGLAYLEEKVDTFDLRKYMTEPLSVVEISRLLVLLNLEPQDIIRKQEKVYKTELKGKSLSRTEWIDILVRYPELIQRPIIVIDNLAVIANPPENLDKIL
jgi:arsenate reductase